MARVLVIRLSALGDVAMLAPVLYSVAKHHPEDEFLLLTKSPLLPLFEYHPANVILLPVFTKTEHKGLRGLWRLIRHLSSQKIDRVADAHNVLRSVQIRFFFYLTGKKIAVINKGKKEKKALVRKHNKVFVPLQTSIERYIAVFYSLGYQFPLDFTSVFEYGGRDFSLIEPVVGKRSGTWIGIAPFAKHRGKIYPLDKMGEVIRLLAGRKDCTVFLFGGKSEESHLEAWANQYENVRSVAGHFSFSSELILMSYLKVMLTMDSGNMHLASLVGTPVVSVWGATHPYAGFLGYGQDPSAVVDVEDLPCRPCSVFGNKACYRKDYACMNGISPAQIVEKIHSVLSDKKIAQ